MRTLYTRTMLGPLTSALLLLLISSSIQAQIAEGKCKFLGNVVNSYYPTDFAQYWNQITPENAGKWQSLESSRDVYNWSGLDIAYNAAINNNFIFKHHTFIWGNQQPAWIETLTSAEQLEEIEELIQLYCDRYPKTDLIDVVNEPISDPPSGTGNGNYINALGGTGATGWDWVIKSFEMARNSCPDAKLLLNEYNIINDNARTTNYLTIINLLKDRGLIDGIGVQGHRFELENATATTLKNNLDRLGATGLPVYISEMDIGNPGNTGTPNDNQQLEIYERVFPVLWNHPAVQGITLWGYKQGEMWQETAYLKRSNNTERPALAYLKEFVPASYGGTYCSPITSVEEEQDGFEVYPNPSDDGLFTIVVPGEVSEIIIRDMRGARIQTIIPQHANVSSVSCSAPPGLYVLQMTKGRKMISQKLVVR